MQLIHKQEIWIPTLQGGLLILACVVTSMGFLLTYIYPFLAINAPIKADVLVIEGWMGGHRIKEVIREFERGGYKKLITIGPPLVEGHHLSHYKTFAELGAATLVTLGFDRDKLVAVSTPDVIRNRTDASAVALRQWIENSDLNIETINLYTFDVHSRRNWLIFNKALAPKVKVGVIVLEPINYDPKQWWVSSAGVKSMLSEAIAYIYARFFDWRA